MTTTTENTLSPAEQKRQGIIDAATRLFRELLATHIDQACLDAQESFQTTEDAPNPEVKLGFSLCFDPMAQSPEVLVKVSWAARRSDEATATVNDPQLGIVFPAPTDASSAATETPGEWLRKASAKGGRK